MSAKRGTVLVVDDEPFNLSVLDVLLSNDYDLMLAKSGEQALRQLDAGYLPDLILLDVIMPGISGYDVCVRLKERKETANIPIIFISAMASQEEESKGLILGAMDYIVKPFNPDLVISRIRNYMELKKLQDFVAAEGLGSIYNSCDGS